MGAIDQKVLQVIIRAKDETAKGIKSAEKHMGGMGTMGKIGAVAAGAAAAALAVGVAAAGGLNKAADAAAEYGGQVVTIQRLTGASAEESSKWAAILGRYGVTGKAAGLVVKSLSTAIAGHSKQLKAAGIATQNADGSNRSSQDVLADLANYYSKAKDKTAAVAVASKVLGRGYMALLPVLANGKKGIDDLSVAAERNGLILSQDQVDSARAYGKAVKDNEDAAKGLEVQVGLIVLPIKTKLMKALGDVLQWFQANKGEIGAWFAGVARAIKPVWDALVAFGTQVTTTLKPIVDWLVATVGGALTDAFSSVKATLEEIKPAIEPLMPYIKQFGKVLLVIAFGPAVLVVGAIIGIIVVLAKIVQVVAKVGLKLAQFGTKVGKVFNTMRTEVKEKIDAVAKFLSDLPTRAREAIDDLVRKIRAPIDAAKKLLDKLNPFHRESPSLVDNVLAGTARIASAYSGLSGMGVTGPRLGAFPSVAMAGAGGGRDTRPIRVYIDGRELLRANGRTAAHEQKSGVR